MAGLTHAHPGTRGRELLTRMAIATAVLEAVLLLETIVQGLLERNSGRLSRKGSHFLQGIAHSYTSKRLYEWE